MNKEADFPREIVWNQITEIHLKHVMKALGSQRTKKKRKLSWGDQTSLKKNLKIKCLVLTAEG